MLRVYLQVYYQTLPQFTLGPLRDHLRTLRHLCVSLGCNKEFAAVFCWRDTPMHKTSRILSDGMPPSFGEAGYAASWIQLKHFFIDLTGTDAFFCPAMNQNLALNYQFSQSLKEFYQSHLTSSYSPPQRPRCYNRTHIKSYGILQNGPGPLTKYYSASQVVIRFMWFEWKPAAPWALRIWLFLAQ